MILPAKLLLINLKLDNLQLTKLQFKNLRLIQLLSLLIFISATQLSHAQVEALPLDLIELLGELDDEDHALDTALLEIELKKCKQVIQTNEVKK